MSITYALESTMRLHKLFLLFIGFLLTSSASGVDIKPTVTKAEDFVPKGWKLHHITHGDLNQDGEPDVALVIQGTDEKKIFPLDYRWFGVAELDSNPRVLLIAFRLNDTYELVLKNEQVLPNPKGIESLSGYGNILHKGKFEITSRNTLKIGFYYGDHCSVTGQENSYTFRYQNNRFELIGLDSTFAYETIETTSINYSTGKVFLTSEVPVFGGYVTHHKEGRIKTKQTYDLQTLDFRQMEKILVEIYAARHDLK
ncbi:MAG: hypothetical protein LBQ81_07525 [Zoogloeaceae bacterium]|jgi:hypothetical protein|nr:hypothetical protein [Zoogloeaceae bacterium]